MTLKFIIYDNNTKEPIDSYTVKWIYYYDKDFFRYDKYLKLNILINQCQEYINEIQEIINNENFILDDYEIDYDEKYFFESNLYGFNKFKLFLEKYSSNYGELSY